MGKRGRGSQIRFWGLAPKTFCAPGPRLALRAHPGETAGIGRECQIALFDGDPIFAPLSGGKRFGAGLLYRKIKMAWPRCGYL